MAVLPRLFILLLHIQFFTAQNIETKKLKIALHAQSRYVNHGWVAGSEITTSGMLAALRRHPLVEVAEVFAPFAYHGLLSNSWDVLFVEGWTGALPSVIQKMRTSRQASSPPLIVLHWCLDTYPDLNTILGLDVDGFATNSRVLLPRLQQIAPTLFLPLAADINEMLPVPKSEEYNHPIVYLGQASKTKHRLLEVLAEVAPLGLAIYGLGWDRLDDSEAKKLLPYWRGVLPKDDIALLYSSAGVIIGTTESEQRELGCVNNRVFEALACEGLLISDKFPDLVDIFGDVLSYHEKPGDAFEVAQYFLSNDTVRDEYARQGRSLVANQHTYDHRVAKLVPWLVNHKMDWIRGSGSRPNKPAILLIYDVSSEANLDLHLCFIPLIMSLDAHYKFSVQSVNMTNNHKWNSQNVSTMLIGALNNYELVLIYDEDWNSELRKAMSEVSRTHPSFHRQEGLDKRGDQWYSRAALGLILAPHALVSIDNSVDLLLDLLEFDLVGHSGNILSSLGHPNFIRTMCVDLDGMREMSEGWDDDSTLALENRHSNVVFLDHVPSREELVNINDIFCSSYSSPDASSRRNALFLHSSFHKIAQLTDTIRHALSCEVPMLFWSRPEELPLLIRLSETVHILSASDGVLFLASLATGAKVNVGAECGDLADILRREIYQVSELHRPPLELWDVKSDKLLSTSLLNAINWAMFGTRANAAISISYPPPGSKLSSEACKDSMFNGDAVISVAVNIQSFRLPHDGKWCLLVDDVQYACVGDVRYHIDLPIPHCDLGERLTVKAVLRSGFEDARILRESPPVELLFV